MITGWGLPPPYRGELGYGTLSRFLARWGHLDHKLMMQQAGGQHVNSLHPMTVPRLANIARACLPHEVDCVGQFIHLHTLLPYATAFDDAASRRMVRELIQAGDSCAAERQVYPSRYLTMFPQTLRLCPDCYLEDIRQVGEPYWHRVHQLPGVFHCVRHRGLLHSTGVAFAIDPGLRAQTPQQAACSFDHKSAVEPTITRALESLLLRPTLDAAAHRLEGNAPPMGSTLGYRSALAEVGYKGRGTELRTSRFESDFSKWMGLHGSQTASFGTGPWWRPLISGVAGRPTTLQHLLMISFIISTRRRQWRQPTTRHTDG